MERMAVGLSVHTTCRAKQPYPSERHTASPVRIWTRSVGSVIERTEVLGLGKLLEHGLSPVSLTRGVTGGRVMGG